MDTDALYELIAKSRETAASLAQAEQRVAAFSAELAEQPELQAVPVRSIKSIPKRSSGWVPAIDKLPERSTPIADTTFERKSNVRSGMRSPFEPKKANISGEQTNKTNIVTKCHA
jgi:hypothetical protein